MMKRRNVMQSAALALGAVMIVAACQPAGQSAAVDKAAEAQAVEQVSMNWLQAAKAHDVDGVVALVAPDAVFFSEGEAPAEGTDAIRADVQDEWNDNPDASIDWQTTSVQVADNGDMAWERGTWTYDPDGMGDAQPLHGQYVTVYKKVDGVWKVASDMGVRTDPGAMEENEAAEDSDMESPTQ